MKKLTEKHQRYPPTKGNQEKEEKKERKEKKEKTEKKYKKKNAHNYIGRNTKNLKKRPPPAVYRARLPPPPLKIRQNYLKLPRRSFVDF